MLVKDTIYDNGTDKVIVIFEGSGNPAEHHDIIAVVVTTGNIIQHICGAEREELLEVLKS